LGKIENNPVGRGREFPARLPLVRRGVSFPAQ